MKEEGRKQGKEREDEEQVEKLESEFDCERKWNCLSIKRCVRLCFQPYGREVGIQVEDYASLTVRSNDELLSFCRDNLDLHALSLQR